MQGITFDCVIVLNFMALVQTAEFQPNWESLNDRPIPEWFDTAKFGVLIHWGLYSAQGIFGETFYEEWVVDQQSTVVSYMKKYYPDSFSFKDLPPLFTCELFDAQQWARIIKSSAARYVIVTAKYNDGFTLWKSPYSSDWNSVSSGPKKNLIGELARAIRSDTSAHFGLHYSLQDVFNPLYISDRASGFQQNNYTLQKLLPEMKEMVNEFKPEIVWIDGATSGEAPHTYYNSTYFLSWLYNFSPTKETVVVNDKWGKGTACKHGGYFSCSPPAHLSHSKQNKAYKWESAIGINRQGFGHRTLSFLNDYRSTEEIIEALVSTVSMGGNLLLTIGATKDGRIDPYVEERLKEIGQWLELYGEAIFSSIPWKNSRDATNRNIWYTSKSTDENTQIVYIFLLKWPSDYVLRLLDVKMTNSTTVQLLGSPRPPLEFSTGLNGLGLIISLPKYPPNELPTCGWVFRMIM